MAQDHTPYTNTVIKVLSLTDPEIEETPVQQEFEDINIVVAIPRENLRVDIQDPMDPHEAESSTQGASRNPPSGTTYDRPRPPLYIRVGGLVVTCWFLIPTYFLLQ